MKHHRYIFLPGHGQRSTKSRQTDELDISTAHSHAAKVSHPRNKARRHHPDAGHIGCGSKILPLPEKDDGIQLHTKGMGQVAQIVHICAIGTGMRCSIPDKFVQQLNVAIDTKYGTDSADCDKTKKQVVNHLLTTSKLVRDQLDPFLRLPLDLSEQDRNILHFYLTTAPGSVFGTSRQSVFCPVRDTGLPCAVFNQVFLKWLVLLTEISIRRLRPSDNDVSALSRRTSIYKLMRKTISKPENWVLDSTLFDIVVAGMAEGRLGEWSTAKKHINAAFALLALRGGLKLIQDMEFSMGVTLLNGFVTIGNSKLFDSLKTLDTASERLLDRLRIFQAWNQQIRSVSQKPVGEVSRQENDPPASSSIRKSSMASYMATRALNLGTRSAIFPYIESCPADDQPGGQECHLAILYSINSILWGFRDNEESAIMFLQTLDHTVRLSQPTRSQPDSSTSSRRLPRLAAVAVLYMVADCARGLGQWNSSEDSAFHSWEVIEFVQLMMLASPNSRMKFTRALSSWLTNLEDIRYLRLLADSDLGNVRDEVHIDWLGNQMACHKSNFDIETDIWHDFQVP